MKNIKALFMDVDGTLTDGIVYIGNLGELCKGFYVRDGIGILKIVNAGIEPIILTSRESDIVKRRAEELGITSIYQGFREKKQQFLDILKEKDYHPDNVAYIGDDINDLECMKIAGWSGCPADAENEVKKIADFISNKKGGNGAVREFCEWLLK